MTIVPEWRLVLRAVIFVTALASTVAGDARAEEESPGEERSRRGYAYIGAFWVADIETQLAVFSQDLPLGTRLDLSKDLGLRDSLTTPRAAIGWRFGRRHLLGMTWYDLSRDGSRNLLEDLDPDGELVPEGATIYTFIELEVYRVSYTYLFHDDPKVKLGIGGGFFIADFGVGLRANLLDEPLSETSDFTAPLPLVGGRLVYRVTPKMRVLLTSDWLFVDYQKFRGLLVDTSLYVEHATFKHIGFGAGLNLNSVDLEIDDDDLFWDLHSSYSGILGVVTFYF